MHRADNYLKLTVRKEGGLTTDYVQAFHSNDRADCVDSLAVVLGLSKLHGGTISVYDARPFTRMGESIPEIGEWHPNDLRRDPFSNFDESDDEDEIPTLLN